MGNEPGLTALEVPEMVERVAKAIWNVSREPEHDGATEDRWPEATEEWRENMRAHARAAIDAMRPLYREAVGKAGMAYMKKLGGCELPPMFYWEDLFNAMLDAALQARRKNA